MQGKADFIDSFQVECRITGLMAQVGGFIVKINSRTIDQSASNLGKLSINRYS
jgi:hypothetical protein